MTPCRCIDWENQLIYLAGPPVERMLGFLGEQTLVNGQPDYSLSASPRAYRMRLLNGANPRIDKLVWDDGTPLTVIATDGMFLEKPVQCSYMMLSPDERVDLWADFSQRSSGEELSLASLPFEGGMMGGLGGIRTWG